MEKSLKKIIFTGILSIIAVTIAGCATPKVVAEREIGDNEMTCAQIMRELSEIREIRHGAEADKGVSGKNVAAALFFWPAIIGNEMNTSNAIEAANKRISYLSGLYEDKGCSGLGTVAVSK